MTIEELVNINWEIDKNRENYSINLIVFIDEHIKKYNDFEIRVASAYGTYVYIQNCVDNNLLSSIFSRKICNIYAVRESMIELKNKRRRLLNIDNLLDI